MKKTILLIGGGIAAGVATALIAVKKTGRQSKQSQGEEADRAENNAPSASIESSNDTAAGSGDRAKSLSGSDDGNQASMRNLGSSGNGAFQEETPIDDHGTDQETASEILTRVRDAAFDASDEKLALALGRPTEEITAWLNGSEMIDGDVLLKLRALAMERGVEIPESQHTAAHQVGSN